MAWYELCANRFLSDFCHKTYGILCLIFRSDWQWWWWRVQLHPYTFAMRKTPCWSIDGIQNSSTRCQRLYTSGCSTEAREQGKYWQPTAALTATHNIHSLFEKASNVKVSLHLVGDRVFMCWLIDAWVGPQYQPINTTRPLPSWD